MKFLRSFSLIVYALALLAIVSFCIATGQIVFLLATGVIAALSWYVTEGPRGFALPKWLANILIVAASVAVVPDLLGHRGDVIDVLGRFTVWLLLIKLYERKSRRDYAQVLWLTVILMVAGALEARSLLFGISLLAYSVLGFYVLLLYQLFAAEERAREERHDQAPGYARFIPPMRPVLGRTVREQFILTTVFVGVSGLVLSTIIFLFAPRGIGAGVLRQLTQVSHRSRTGFVEQVNLLGGVGNRITDSQAPIMRVHVENPSGRPAEVPGGLYLRGAALDRYNDDTFTWSASSSRTSRLVAHTVGENPDSLTALGRFETNSAREAAMNRSYEIEVAPVTPMGTHAFTMLFPVAITSARAQRCLYNERTQEVEFPNAGAQPGVYRVLCDPTPVDETLEALTGGYSSGPVIRSRYDNPQVRALAEEVITDAELPSLAPPTFPEKGRYNRRAAQAISDHFRRGFTYTLDLSDVQVEGDPIEAFLFEFRRGHCEFYASAMTAMLQSIGVDARLVTGFLCSEYRGEGGYMVRESHAHAWVEVRTGVYQWTTFDPTPPGDLEAIHNRADTLANRMQGIWENLEVGWMQNVVEYDTAAQADVQQSLHLESLAWIDDVVVGVDDWVADVADRFGVLGIVQIIVIASAVVVAILIVVRAVRRARRIRQTLQLGHLHGAEYRRMLHQLGFYIDMLDVLRRGGLRKPQWQPPLAFADDIRHRQPAVVPFVRELSSLFYRARYGGHELSTEEREEAQQTVQSLAETLSVRA